VGEALKEILNKNKNININIIIGSFRNDAWRATAEVSRSLSINMIMCTPFEIGRQVTAEDILTAYCAYTNNELSASARFEMMRGGQRRRRVALSL